MKLPNEVRKKPTFTAIPGLSSCWTDAEVCQLYARLPKPVSTSSAYLVFGDDGAELAVVDRPALAVRGEVVEIAIGDVIAVRVVPRPGRALDDRLCRVDRSRVVARPNLATYRPNVTFTAVLPLPNRSYAAPRRGARSLKFGTLSILAKSNAWTNRPAGRRCAGT